MTSCFGGEPWQGERADEMERDDLFERWPNANYVGSLVEYRGHGHAYEAGSGWWFERTNEDGTVSVLAVRRDELRLEGEC